MPTKQGDLALFDDPVAQRLLQSTIPARGLHLARWIPSRHSHWFPLEWRGNRVGNSAGLAEDDSAARWRESGRND